MDTFIVTIKKIYNDIEIQKDYPSILINNIVIQKQYLIYYIYRIICHHYSFFRSISMDNIINNINIKLDIGSKNRYICIPLANKMTVDEIKLNDLFQIMIKLFIDSAKKIQKNNNIKQNDINMYLTTKTYDVIIKDIKKLIKFIPNLSKYNYI